MILQLDYLISCAIYSIKTRLLKQDIPLISGLVLNDDCNLNCKYCALEKNKNDTLTIEEVCKALTFIKEKGINAIAITGGEPLLWKDGDHRINDILEISRAIGIKVTSVYTNGTLPLDVKCDNLFVSLDGTKETTQKLRGPIFDKVLENIHDTSHPKIFINCTINQLNKDHIEEFCHWLNQIKKIRGIYFYFHTPYKNKDPLALNQEEKVQVLNNLIQWKKDYPILNSYSCLKDAIHNRWSRPSKGCSIYTNKKKFHSCCRAISDPRVCENCGYLGYLEVENIIKMSPSALWDAMKYLPSKGGRNSCLLN